MRTKGHEVHRPIKPIALEISEDEKALKDPHAYAVKVRTFSIHDALVLISLLFIRFVGYFRKP